MVAPGRPRHEDMYDTRHLICCHGMSLSVAARRYESSARFGFFAVWLLCLAPPAFADCNDLAGNQILNCGFEEGDPPVDWTAVYGQEFQRQSPGLEGFSAASLVPESTAPFGFWGILLRSECFPLTEDTIFCR